MENQVKNPLVIRCEYCGGDLNYDIVKQRYCCEHCGAEASSAEKKADYHHWKSLRKEAVMRDMAQVKSFSCPTCGAQTIVNGENATARCPFCQNTMIDAQFAGNDIPEVIIPFKLNKEEAQAKLSEWIKSNRSKSAAKAIEKNLPHLTGCYLPYHIVRGAYDSELHIRLQDGTSARYPFRAYLSHTAVNASKDLSNLFLDGIEPFDFDDALEFNFGYLNHQEAKVQNISGKALESRITEETQTELYKGLSKEMRTKEMSVFLGQNDNESIPALLPVYFVRCKGGITAAVNGQTGKVSIDTGKTKNLTRFWWIAPLVATLIVGLVGAYFGDVSLGFAGVAVFGLVFFAIAHNRHHEERVQVIQTYPKTKEEHNDTQVEFFADFGNGPVPAKLKFFTFGRILKTVPIILGVIFLPVLIAVPIQLLRGLPLSSIHIGYGAAWYCIPGFFAILAAGGLAKTMMYGSPLYYEILPNGKTRRRKLPSQKMPKLKELLAGTKFAFSDKTGCLIIGFIVFLLVGSVAAMIS